MTHEDVLKDIKANPDKHRHKHLNDLINCCMFGGAIDISVMDAHEGLCGSNGGTKCDVMEGPCSCGGWH